MTEQSPAYVTAKEIRAAICECVDPPGVHACDVKSIEVMVLLIKKGIVPMPTRLIEVTGK